MEWNTRARRTDKRPVKKLMNGMDLKTVQSLFKIVLNLRRIQSGLRGF